MKPAFRCFTVAGRSTWIVAALLGAAGNVVASVYVVAADQEEPPIRKVQVSDDGGRFVFVGSDAPFVPWGFNYLGEFGKLIEDSWDHDWPQVESDFREMRELGVNVVRIHLQFGTYMTGPDEFDQAQLDRLKKLLELSREVGMYLDITGLSCYRLDKIPRWYDELDEEHRWEVQARWWAEIAKTCTGHPAVFCYDLMNEPIIGGPAAEGEPRWVGGELAGFYFVQRISESPGERSSVAIAEAWTRQLTEAIRRHDPETLITVGVIPWAQVWPNAKPVFYAPEVARHFDFVSIHAYPGKNEVDRALHAVSVYDIGKPLVVEETFPLNCTLEEMDRFVDAGKDRVDGWISHYFGHTIQEHEQGAEPFGTAPDAPFGVTVAQFLAYWRDKGQALAGMSPTPDKRDEERGPRSDTTGTGAPAELVVRGSVGQIHVANARKDAGVSVRGPGGFQRTAATDACGGLVLRDIPPGNSYSVTIDGNNKSYAVRVMGRDQHPDAAFYSAQQLEPTRGYVKTRDGTLLSYRAVLPDSQIHGNGPYDVVITYSGYQPGLETADGYQNNPFNRFSELGYAVVGVNMRGSGCSGGAFDLMEPLTWLDGYDIIEAFAAQEWVDDIALGDQSWPGLTQLFVASTQPPSLDAIVPGSAVGDFYRDVFFPGGIQNVGFGHIWGDGRDAENAFPSSRKEVNSRIETDSVCAANQSLRGQNVSIVESIERHIFDDDYWRTRCAERLVGRITVPTLQIVSWQDPQTSGRAAILYESFPQETPVRLVGVNGFHQYYSGAVWDEIVRFLEVYLGDADEAEVRAYEAKNDFVVLLESNGTGDVRGRFTLPGFGAAGDGRRLRLGQDLAADSPDESGESSTFNYDPDPDGSWIKPVQDQVSFTSQVLNNETAMAGSGSVDLWIAADTEDVDLQATLSEIRPDGQEMLVQSGWLRASHRALDDAVSTALRPRHLHTAESIRKLSPGEWTRVRIELTPFAHVFREGSRVQLTISGPGAAGNAWPWSFDALPGGFDVKLAHNSNERESAAVLPVVQPSDLDLPASLPKPDSVVLQPCRPVR